MLSALSTVYRVSYRVLSFIVSQPFARARKSLAAFNLLAPSKCYLHFGAQVPQWEAQSDELQPYVSVSYALRWEGVLLPVCVCACAANVAVKVLLRNTTMSLMRLPNEFHFISYICVFVCVCVCSLEVEFKCSSQNLLKLKLHMCKLYSRITRIRPSAHKQSNSGNWNRLRFDSSSKAFPCCFPAEF